MRLLIILLSSFIYGNNLSSLPFDWSGQFGLFNHQGTLLWNNDWYSKSLFFDGTWSVYPTMYGDEIKKDFNFSRTGYKDIFGKNDNQENDSYFKYDQGDYLLDRFSCGIILKTKRRLASFNGFKRTYSGNKNQYANNSYQPQQQSYVFSYKSNEDQQNLGFTLGHFDTYSGFPDGTEIGLIDNQIITSNLNWGNKLLTSYITLSSDQFYQKYKTKHTLSSYHKSRFLIRKNFELDLILPTNNQNLFANISHNSRSINIDTTVNIKLNNYLIGYGNDSTKIIFSIFQLSNKFLFQTSLDFKKKIGPFVAKINYGIDYKPIHPYYLLFLNENITKKEIQRKKASALIYYKFKNSRISSSFYQINDEEEFWSMIDSNNVNNLVHRMLSFDYSSIIFNNTEVKLKYNIQNSDGLYSGGIKNWLEIGLSSNFKVLDDKMIINLNCDFIQLSYGTNKRTLNPIEMVPDLNSSDIYNSNPVNVINTSITAKVNDFIISYESYNFIDIIYNSINLNRGNSVYYDPTIPDLGHQTIISIKWAFKD